MCTQHTDRGKVSWTIPSVLTVPVHSVPKVLIISKTTGLKSDPLLQALTLPFALCGWN
jgi:hypothetical protein